MSTQCLDIKLCSVRLVSLMGLQILVDSIAHERCYILGLVVLTVMMMVLVMFSLEMDGNNLATVPVQGLTGSRYPTRPDLFFNYPTRPVPKFENDRVAGNY